MGDYRKFYKDKWISEEELEETGRWMEEMADYYIRRYAITKEEENTYYREYYKLTDRLKNIFYSNPEWLVAEILYYDKDKKAILRETFTLKKPRNEK